MILIACATAQELEFWQPQRHVEMLVTGIGPVEAACAVSRALAQSPYDLVINAGIGGILGSPRGAEIGEGVVISDELIEFGLETAEALSLPENVRVVDHASSDLPLVDRLVELGFKSLRGITVSRVTCTDETAARLAKLGVGVESMEGFAVLRAAEIAGVPAVEVRGISNLCGNRADSQWNFKAGVQGLERILTALLKTLGPKDER